ncbi:uncharacterized protein [Montipora foliosa]|uniref:uncharacterized protein n=1 Tax=Montipora foliosa TaxID=591990 RepID=UPI0035F20836
MDQGAHILKEESEWPKCRVNENIPLSSDDPEVKKTSSCATSTEEMKASPVGLVDYFSDWYKVKRAIAICLRYLNWLANKGEAKRTEEAKACGTSKDTKEIKMAGNTKLSVQELQMAEVKIIKLAQATSFREEIKLLNLKKADSSPCSGSQCLTSLAPWSSLTHLLILTVSCVLAAALGELDCLLMSSSQPFCQRKVM